MSLSYQPNSDADPSDLWDTTFLSDRDVSSQVPINFVPHPGVAVTAICFGNGVYADQPTQQCLSNLLASQIRRFVFDIYWDVTNRQFSLCPVEIPNLNSTSTSSKRAPSLNYELSNLIARQNSSTTISSNSSASTATATTTTSSAVTPTTTTVDGDQLVVLGPYQCSTDLTLGSITDLFNQYLASTSNTLQAKINLWELNVHVAATPENPTQPRSCLTSSELPSNSELLTTYFEIVGDVLYTPAQLQTDRANLNSSWFSGGITSGLPLTSYFTTNTISGGQLSSPDGWPNEDFVQVVKGKRMLVGIGSLDEQLSNYNYSGDEDRIFPPGTLSSQRQVTVDSDGHLQSGCFYNGNEFEVSQVNNSWAVSTVNQVDPPNLGMAADNFTTCGISPILNTTINNAFADVSPLPYQNYGNQAVFSWAYGEPQSDANQSTDAAGKFRCALMVSNSDYTSHWRVQFCSDQYRVACRVANEPYKWQLSSYTTDYASGVSACPANTSFDVPRTGLENTYLYNYVLGEAQSANDQSILNGIWINFNSLDEESCWVTTGPEGRCPYYQDSDAVHSRHILIPTIAALIVLLLTVLTILIKCTTNRRKSRARKRGEGGWDYEGVPS